MRLDAVLSELVKAARCAEALKRDAWDFAVEARVLTAMGLTATDLRFLLYGGWVEHSYETTARGEPRRTFERGVGVALADASVFVLTPDGLRRAGERTAMEAEPSTRLPHPTPAPSRPETATVPADEGKPRWDAERRELTFAGRLVKRFRVPAPNQTAILEVFHEEAWPYRIDDPLPPASDMDAKLRLRDTIKCLNRGGKGGPLVFCGDGSGTGVVWRSA